MTFLHKLAKRLARVKAAPVIALLAAIACERPVAITGSSPTHAGHYVSPSGSASGDGSAGRPWDLRTAFAQPAAVHPGDTIWLRGGTYSGGANGFTSSLLGMPSAPIVVRQYPGERATLTDRISLNGGYTWYWGFEVANTIASARNVGVGLNVLGLKVINLIVHDAGGTGVSSFVASNGAEIYGCVLYYNGYNNDDVSGPAHGIYTQNQAPYTKVLKDNIILDTYGFGIHAYGSGAAFVQNFVLDGNVVFNNGGGAELLVGGNAVQSGNRVLNNMIYTTAPKQGLAIGQYGDTPAGDVVIQGNYVVNGYPALALGEYQTILITGNTLHSPNYMVKQAGPTAGYTWTNQTYYGDSAQPSFIWLGQGYTFAGWKAATGFGSTDTYVGAAPPASRVFVRPNAYEPGRANIVVYNWAQAASAVVDVSNVLTPGDRYEVRNVENYFGTPVASGTYTGGAIQVPMAPVARPAPIAGGSFPATGPTFGVFVLLRTSP
jgi:hypothetical protein